MNINKRILYILLSIIFLGLLGANLVGCACSTTCDTWKDNAYWKGQTHGVYNGWLKGRFDACTDCVNQGKIDSEVCGKPAPESQPTIYEERGPMGMPYTCQGSYNEGYKKGYDEAFSTYEKLGYQAVADTCAKLKCPECSKCPKCPEIWEPPIYIPCPENGSINRGSGN